MFLILLNAYQEGNHVACKIAISILQCCATYMYFEVSKLMVNKDIIVLH